MKSVQPDKARFTAFVVIEYKNVRLYYVFVLCFLNSWILLKLQSNGSFLKAELFMRRECDYKYRENFV